ncbi:MAG: 3-deoxy-8-phosphooctulonate synthase [Candidatus Aminicenantes bacterium]|nr:3-deoxy-8-phosphooctulonate synthase [Candidatus Aminicenantes bacterium]
MERFKIGNIYVPSEPFFLIAGPCVIESLELVLEVGGFLKELTEKLGIPYIFKASFDKANRTSIDSFRGPGIERGLEILKELKDKLSIPVTTDIHEPWQAEKAAKVVDLIQIPAFLSRQTDLLVSAARTGKPVSIKKGQFLSPWDMKKAVEKIERSGGNKIILIERGTFFGYGNLVVDFRSIPIMRKFGYPVVIDATHSVQKPSALGNRSGGEPEFIMTIASAGIAVGADGVFMEVHPRPNEALSDGANSMPLENVEENLKKLLKLWEARK